MPKKRVKISGVRKIKQNFARKVRQTAKRANKIALEPTEPIVSEIRNQLRNDTINGPLQNKRLNHVFEGELLRNTFARITGEFSSGLDHLTEISLGYHVNYGLNLELGSGPTFVSLQKISRWALSRPSPQPNPLTVQRKLAAEGSQAYPIIGPVFSSMQDNYRDEVFKRVRAEWA